MKTGNLEIEKTNQKYFYDTVQTEYLKITEKYPVDFDKEFDIRGEVLFNNRLVKGFFWHSNNDSVFCMSSVDYKISVPPNSAYTFPTKKEAEDWLKKYKGNKITDKSKVKIKKNFSNFDSMTYVSKQLEIKYFHRVLEFKKTNVKVLKWYE